MYLFYVLAPYECFLWLPLDLSDEKTIHNLPKTDPHQDFSSPGLCPRDRSHEQTPSTMPPHGHNDRGAPHQECDYVVRGSFSPPRAIQQTIRTIIPLNQHNRDTCPHNGSELFAHPPRSGGQPVHLSPLLCPGSKSSTRRQNPKGHRIFFSLMRKTYSLLRWRQRTYNAKETRSHRNLG